MLHLLILLLSFVTPRFYSLEPQAQFTTYTTADGLSDNSINALLQDSCGYVWIATENGLCRFDGYRFHHYKHSDANAHSLPHNRVFALCLDTNHQLWVATSYGLARYRRETDDFCTPSLEPRMKAIPNQYIRHVQCDSLGRIWFSTPAALCYFNAQQTTVNVITLPENKKLHKTPFIQSMSVELDGTVWLGVDNELWCYHATEKKLIPVSQFVANNNDEVISSITSLCGVSVLFGTNQGRMFAYNDFVRKITTLPMVAQQSKQASSVSALYQDGCNAYALIKKLGIAKLGTVAEPLQNSFFSQIDNCDLSCMLFDRQGNCWLGHHKRGVSFAPRYQEFVHITADPLKKHFLQSTVISALYADNKQGLWIGTDGGGVHRMVANEIHPYSIAGMPSDESVMWIGSDNADGLWLGTFRNGVFHYNPTTHAVQHLSTQHGNLPCNDVRKVITDRRGVTWLLTHGKGITAWHNGIIANYNSDSISPTQLAGNWTYDVLALPDNTLAVGTNDGLSIITPDREKTINHRASAQNPSLANNNVYCLWFDGKQTLWCGTQEGISLFDILKQRFVAHTLLPGYSIASFASIARNQLWIATNNGIHCVSPTSLQVLKTFDNANGLIHSQFSTNAACTNAQQLYFGGTFGLYQLMPTAAPASALVRKAIVTDILINNQSVHDSALHNDYQTGRDTAITLSYTQNSLEFQFSALDYSITNKTSYDYRLDGLDTAWHRTAQPQAVFTNLPVGNYCFQLRATVTDGSAATPTFKLYIHILPPWWRTWWAYGLYALIVLLLALAAYIYLYVGMRTRHQIALEKAKNKQIEELYQAKIRFFTNISHDIRTPLTLISSPIAGLLARPSLDGETRQTLSIVKRNTAQLLQLVNELLEFRKIEAGAQSLHLQITDVWTLLCNVMRDFENRAQQHNIQFELPPRQQNLYAQVESRYFEKALYNILANAFKFTPDGGKIAVSICTIETPEHKTSWWQKARLRNQIEISIHDSGPGIPAEILPHLFEQFYEGANPSGEESSGLGLNIARSIVEQHGGTISCRNNTGAQFIIHLPLENAPLITESVSETISPTPEMVATPILADAQAKLFTVLVVDDNEDLRNYITRQLAQYYTVTAAANGAEGFEQALAVSPDVIISDVMMPLTDGFEFCAKIKQSLETSHIPVLLLTAKTMTDDVREGYRAGADDYLTKPFDLELLLLKLGNILKTRAQLRSRFSVETKDISAITDNSVDNRFMTAFMREIEQNYSNAELSVEQIGETIGLSRSHLYKKCLALTGKTPVDILQEVRIQNAINLIKNTDLTISEIAYSVGYSDPRYFSSRFRKLTGVTPTDMRNH